MYNPREVELNNLFDNLEVKKSNFSGPRVLSKEELITYVELAIMTRGEIRHNALISLLHNYGKEVEKEIRTLNGKDLEEIIPDILNKELTVIKGDKIFKGVITKTGDGRKGLLGNGPITYHWKGLDVA